MLRYRREGEDKRRIYISASAVEEKKREREREGVREALIGTVINGRI